MDKTGDCWEWTGFVTPNGYGRVRRRGGGGHGMLYAHRYAYTYWEVSSLRTASSRKIL